MKSIESIHNLNDSIIELESKLIKNIFNQKLLIRESFILWYILVEDLHCESFENEEIERLLKRNFKIFQTKYLQDVDFNFIMGWMISVAFWHFNSDFNEEYGSELLFKAYQRKRDNLLFKWAVRNKLNLKDNEIHKLKKDIHFKFDQWYGYGDLIKAYFLDIIQLPGPPF